MYMCLYECSDVCGSTCVGTCTLGYGGQRLTESVFLGHSLTFTLFTKAESLPELSPGAYQFT